MSVGDRIRRARAARSLSLHDVASKAHISVATLSRVERDKQGLDLGLFLMLARILRMAPSELVGGETTDSVDPLVQRIGSLDHKERLQLWRDLTAERRNRGSRRSRIDALNDQVEELLAQLDYVRGEMLAVQSRMPRRRS